MGNRPVNHMPAVEDRSADQYDASRSISVIRILNKEWIREYEEINSMLNVEFPSADQYDNQG